MQSYTTYLTHDTASVSVYDEVTQEVVTLRLFRGPRARPDAHAEILVSFHPADKPKDKIERRVARPKKKARIKGT